MKKEMKMMKARPELLLLAEAVLVVRSPEPGLLLLGLPLTLAMSKLQHSMLATE